MENADVMQEIKGKIDSLLKRRHKLIEEAKRANARLQEGEYAKKALSSFLEGKNLPSAGRLYRMREKIEFQISTEAYTPKIEKVLIEQLKGVEKELSEAKKGEWIRKKLLYATQNLEKAQAETKKIDAELVKVRAELDELFKRYRNLEKSKKKEEVLVRVREQRKRRESNEDKGMKEEFPEHFKPHEKYVSLEEICIIEKN